MNALIPLIGAGALLFALKKKTNISGADVGTGGSGSSGGASSVIEIHTQKSWIHPLLNKVKFQIVVPGEAPIEIDDKLKDGNISRPIGNYHLTTKVEGTYNEKQKYDPYGALNIAITNSSQNKVLRAVRVLVNDKKVIYVK